MNTKSKSIEALFFFLFIIIIIIIFLCHYGLLFVCEPLIDTDFFSGEHMLLESLHMSSIL